MMPLSAGQLELQLRAEAGMLAQQLGHALLARCIVCDDMAFVHVRCWCRPPLSGDAVTLRCRGS